MGSTGTATGRLPRRPMGGDWRPGHRATTVLRWTRYPSSPGHSEACHGGGSASDRSLAGEERGSYRSGPVRVGVLGGITVHRLGLIALIDELDVASARDATEGGGPVPDVLVLADPTDAHSFSGASEGTDAEEGPGEHSVPVIVTTAEAVRGRDVLRCLTGPVRGVVTLAAPPTTWAGVITGVVAGGYAVDPVLTRELVLLAAVGTPYGPRPLGLTAQQQRILDLVATGMSNRAIAGELGISPDTVKTHLAAAMRHLDAGDRVEAAKRLATERGVMG